MGGDAAVVRRNAQQKMCALSNKRGPAAPSRQRGVHGACGVRRAPVLRRRHGPCRRQQRRALSAGGAQQERGG